MADQRGNLVALTDLSGAWINRVHARKPQTTIVLDIDSRERETHGAQEGSAYNGHFGCTRYHPLFVFSQFGDLERCILRPSNVHSADGWRDISGPVIDWYRTKMKRYYFRADAAFANPDVYELLEAEDYKYTIRLPANLVLQESIAWLLTCPVGQPPHEVRRHHASFSYRARSWNKPRRVVAKVGWHPGQIFPTVGFIVTNMVRPAERVVAFYNHRGAADPYIKEDKNAVTWAPIGDVRSDAGPRARIAATGAPFDILASYLTGLAIDGAGMWRLMFGLGALPGLLFFVGLIFLPESPRWLILKGLAADARASLQRLRGAASPIDREFAEIVNSARPDAGRKSGYRALLEPTIRPAVIVGAGLFFLQKLSGINAVIYYAPEIFNHAGFDSASAQTLATVGIGTVNLVTTILAMYLIDKVGRRPLLMLGFLGTATTMLMIAFAVVNPTLLPSWVIIAALMLYIASFAISIGPLPHVLMSEIFPL